METQHPTTANRVTAATLGGAITITLVWIMRELYEINPPAEVIVAMSTIVTFFVSLVYARFPGIFHISKQQGFAHPLILALLAVVAMGLLAGCQHAQHRAPATMYEQLLIANVYGEYATHTVNDLRRAGVMTTEHHQRALDHLQVALDASKLGRVAYQAGNFRDTQDNLERAESAMTVVAFILAPHLPDTPDNQAFITRYGGTP